jgi:hypothetical protein
VCTAPHAPGLQVHDDDPADGERAEHDAVSRDANLGRRVRADGGGFCPSAGSGTDQAVSRTRQRPDKPEMRIWVWATSAGVARLLNGPYQAFAPVAQRIAHLTTDLKGGPNERAHSHPSRSRTSQRVRCKMIMRSEAAAKPQKLQKLRQMVQGLSKSRRE